MNDEPTAYPSLDDYLERARRAWPSDEPPPSSDRLRQIADSVGMTDDASEAADRRAGQLTAEGQQAFEDGDDDRARELLRDAFLLSPVRLQPLFVLARIYGDRYGDDGDEADRELAIDLADRALQLDPEHTPTRNLVEKLGRTPQDGLSWKLAVGIVAVIVAISGTMQMCDRWLAPETTDEQKQEVQDYLEEHGEPPR